MNPIREGLTKYQDFNLPLSYSTHGGAMQFVPTGNTPTYVNSTTYRGARNRRQRKNIDVPEGGVDVKKVVKKVAKVAAPLAIDTAFKLGETALTPLLAEELGPLAPVAVKLGSTALRKVVKNKTGYGKPRGRPRKRGGCDNVEAGAYVNIDLMKMLSQLFNDVDLTGPLASIKNAIEPVLKQWLSSNIDSVMNFGVKKASDLLSQAFHNPDIGKAFSTIVRQFMRSQFGGKKPIKQKRPARVKKETSSDVGIYKGGKRKRQPKGKSTTGNDKRKLRGQMISKIMKEQGVNLATASKMIKEKGLI
jgi:hypothetical protein